MWREPLNCKKLGKELTWRSPGTFSTPLLVLYSSPFTSSWTSSWLLVASTASSGRSIESGHSSRQIRPEIFSTWFCSFHRWMMVLLYNFQMAQSGQVWDWWLLHGSLLAWSCGEQNGWWWMPAFGETSIGGGWFLQFFATKTLVFASDWINGWLVETSSYPDLESR